MKLYLLKVIAKIIHKNILRELKRKFSNFFKLFLLTQASKGKKNAVAEGFNISSGGTLPIIESDFTVDIVDSIF